MSTSTLHRIFTDRRDAGRQLAGALSNFAGDTNLAILALPRGGVPVAAEVARALHQPFDLMVVRKLGVPGNEEVAFGAIASGGVRALSEDLIRRLGLTEQQVDAITAREREILQQRESFYQGKRALPALAGKTVIVVDDGVATGSTMSAAIELLRYQEAGRIVVAVPVGPRSSLRKLAEEADAVVALHQPDPFGSVGQWYGDFSQTSVTEVKALLAEIQPPDESAPMLRSCPQPSPS